jgi:FG-GAP-like repeat
MAQRDSAAKRRWLIGGSLFALLIVVVLASLFRRDGGGGGLTADEALELVASKNVAVALLENYPNDDSLDGQEADAIFGRIAERLPGERLPVQDRAILRLLILERHVTNRKREAASTALTEAESALRDLRRVAGESALTHILAGQLAQLALEIGLTQEIEPFLREYRAATRLAPDDGVLWSDFYAKARDLPGDEVREQAREALRRAYELRPRNIVLLVEWLVAQVEVRDPGIVETLQAARERLGWMAGSLKQRGGDLDQLVEQAIAAVQGGTDADWLRVRRNVNVIANLVRPDPAYQFDRLRLARHPLEYTLHEFSEEFRKSVELPVPESPVVPVKFAMSGGFPSPRGVTSIELCDFDLDDLLDVVVAKQGRVEIYGRDRVNGLWQQLASAELPAGITRIHAVDLDRDMRATPGAAANAAAEADAAGGEPPRGRPAPDPPAQAAAGPPPNWEPADVDLIAFGPAGLQLLRNELTDAGRSLTAVPQGDSLSHLRDVRAVAVADFDHDGDLDLVVSSGTGLSFWIHQENFRFAELVGRSDLPPEGLAPSAILPVDWNHDVSIDFLLVGPDLTAAGVLENNFHGRFRWHPFSEDVAGSRTAVALGLADVDGNASWDVITGGPDGIALTLTRTLEPGNVTPLRSIELSDFAAAGLLTWDFDNSGDRDVLAWGEQGVHVQRGMPDGRFTDASEVLVNMPRGVIHCEVGDLDRDGDEDLLIATPDRVVWSVNEGGSDNNWIEIALNSEANPQLPGHRTNPAGIGSLLELKAGGRYQPQVVRRQKTHFGLGKIERADALRVLFTNGIPQNVIRPETRQWVFEKQRLLKGSCPYLYTWTGTRYEFLTDLLWAAPIGLQFAEGVMAPSREWEYLLIPGDRLAAIEGEYRLQITEELWEAGYFDEVELLAIDHPAEAEVYSNEKVGPAEIAEFKVHTVRAPRMPLAARDQRGRDVLELVAKRDDRYLRAFERRYKQGLAEPHSLELDLGDLDGAKQITLFLTGWMFPTDTSVNIALSQDPSLEPPRPPALWVPGADGAWQNVMPYMGFPGGKTKTIAVDLSDAFLTDDYRVRIATSMEICWDQAFFAVDEEPVPLEQRALELIAADLHYRGFSERIEHPGHGPESYDYERVSVEPAWPPMQGRFTRYGAVTDLVRASDDRLVVMGAGDEMTLRFRVPDAPPPAGWTRDFILHNVGWDKDADLNTVTGQTVEPLPYRAMQQYPPGPGDTPPDSPEFREYLRTYQTREQEAADFWWGMRGGGFQVVR